MEGEFDIPDSPNIITSKFVDSIGGITSESSKKRNSKRLDKLNIKIQVNQEEGLNGDHASFSSHSISSHVADTALSAPHCLNKRKRPENFYFNGL